MSLGMTWCARHVLSIVAKLGASVGLLQWQRKAGIGLLVSLFCATTFVFAQSNQSPDGKQGGPEPLVVFSVTLIEPNDGATFTPPATINMSAQAEISEDGERITKVDFYANGGLIGTDTSGPTYTFSWANVGAGNYNIHAVGHSNFGSSLSSGTANVTVSAPTNQLPSITLTSPTNGQVITGGSSVTLAADASDSDGTIARIEFYYLDVLLGTDTTSPYSAVWTPNIGTYAITARAIDNGGGTTNTAASTLIVNDLPRVALLEPVSGTIFHAPATVNLEAGATDSDGTIDRVEFYSGGTLLSTDTTSPYTYTWSGVPAGSYNLTARAYDNRGASVTSSGSGQIIVNQPPTVAIIAPASGTLLQAPATITVQADAADVDDGVARVEFYANGLLQVSDTVAPYTWQASNLAAGTYALTAKAIDSRGGSTVSGPSTLIVNAQPAISLTSPASGLIVNAPGSITLSANASDPDDSISKVEFYQGGTLLATGTVAPYTQFWNDIPAGTYTVTAKAYDGRGGVVTSAAASVIVNQVPTVSITAPASGSIVAAPANVMIEAAASDADDGVAMVEFYINGALQASDVSAPFALQANNLGSGTYTLMAKAYDNRGGATLSATTTLVVNAFPSIALTSPTSGLIVNAPGSITLSANASDPDDSISKVEFYQGGTLLATDTVAPYTQFWNDIPAGTYTVTAKAYDGRGGVVTSAAASVIVNQLPSVSITAPASGSVVVAPATVLIEAAASDADDGIAMVEFYVDGVLRATDVSAPFSLQALNMPAATYTLTAKAYDNRGGTMVSAASTLIVNQPPEVQLVSPANNTTLIVPKTITLAATANDTDGAINRVEFYSGTTLLGTATSSPYQISWSVAAAGDHVLSARAYDNRGASSNSVAATLRARSTAFELIADQTPTSLASELPQHDPTVGKVAGTPGVSGGAASFDIPVIVPPGRRGMQPKLSLGYSSRGGNGIAGMGWSLSGLSSIHRCPMTAEQDGQIKAVALVDTDKLCLDGQRLVLTSGTYGAANATYGTELESFSRVTQLGGALSAGGTYFKVERKSGEIAFYGNNGTAASPARVVPGGASVPLTWMMTRVEDRVGNAIDYVYASMGGGETLIESIFYTGYGTTLGTRRVTFTYEDRPGGFANDIGSSYLAGGVTRQTKRLTAILTSVGTEWVRSLVLNYGGGVSTTTGRSLLQSVSDCAHDGVQWACKQPTYFTWQQGAPTYTLTAPALVPGSGSTRSLQSVGDMDGDGAAEIIVDYRYIVSLTPERSVRWSMPIPTQYTLFDTRGLSDFNQDGRVDFVARDATGYLVVRSWSGSPTDTDFETAFGTVINTGVYAPATGTGAGTLLHVGDLDGDGRADLIVQRTPTTRTTACAATLHLYRNVPNGTSPPTFSEMATHCLKGYLANAVIWFTERLQTVRDFDGDGLADLWIDSYEYQWTDGSPKGTRLDRVLFGSKVGTTYALTAKPFSSLFATVYPQSPDEAKPGLFTLWTDINGDGLDDFVYVRYELNAGGRWSVRYNRGGLLGQAYHFNSGAGLAGCGGRDVEPSRCQEIWQPWQSKHLAPQDVDGDGRNEILFPARFAANVCTFKPVDPGQCPGGDGTGLACYQRWVCPEDPTTAQSAVNGVVVGVASDEDGDGHPDPSAVREIAIGAHSYGFEDFSSYTMRALRFSEAADGTPLISEVETGIVSGPVNLHAEDLYGDGHTDSVLMTSPEFGDRGSFGILVEGQDGVPVSESVSPRTLPNGLPIFTGRILVNENRGPAGALNADRLTPQTQDLLAMATDGLGVQTLWNYAPLSGKAGRPAGTTPLYTVPMQTAARYIDERHIYFTSSMPVVSDMIQSDGIGGYRSWRYGYGEAMYNTQGRGFQGFRTLIEEDEATGLRTTTTFHQKFPLTSQPESIVLNPIVRTGTSGPIKFEKYTWRCNLAKRSDTTACAPKLGTPTKFFPYLDTKEVWTYDATTAALPGAGVPAVTGYVQEVAAADATCSGSFGIKSAYDSYGNLTARAIHSRDLGSGAGGTRNLLDRHCMSETNTYAPTTADWWLDKLTRKVVKTKVIWDGTQHPLPAGTSNPFYSVTTDYVWNPNRTLASETLQPGVSNQQRVTAYTYPSGNNYGLPTTVTVTASGDPNGARATGTTYSPDGYFPLTVTNALNHTAATSVRLRDGQPISTTDPNGMRTLVQYDAFGMTIRKQFRGLTDAQYLAPDQFTAVTQCSGCNPGEITQVTQVQDGTPTALSRLDQLGRLRRKVERQMDGVWTQVATEYNARGQVVRQSEPIRTGETTWYWTEFTQYDLIGRLLRKVAPQQAEDGRGDLATTYAYSGRTTNIQVCGTADIGTGNCLNLSRTTDSLGRYVETVDAQGGRTRFWYEANGNVAAIEDAKAVVTRAVYSAIGKRTSVNDPNQGTWNFTYDALGELLTQTDARGVATSLGYDKLSRPRTRNVSIDVTGDGTADTVADSWEYDPVNALGQEASQQRSINGVVERSTTSTYDALARPVQRDIVQAMTAGGPQSYRLRQRYDSYYGRANGQEFPNGEAVEVVYSAYGHALQERDPATGTAYRVLGGVNARGQPVLETFGGTLQTQAGYWPATGQVQALVQAANGIEVRRLGYGYDVFGNLTRQTLNTSQVEERYRYDALHRLVEATRTGAATDTVRYGYDAVGNFTHKSDFSTAAVDAYSYSGGSCGGGAHAVKSVALAAGGTRTYCFDANGNLTGDNAGLSLRYDHQNLPVVVQRGSLRDEFRYGPDGQRTRSSGSDGSRVYLPGYEHRTETQETKVYVGDYAVITRSGATRRVEYLLKDRLGSVDAIASASGTLTETRGYDAFGKPRSGTWADLSPARLPGTTTTPKGFTQHTHLDQLELIHMNGRVFDYNLGRFTGVDPFIQFPLNSQSLNPYSYIMNNPLSGTDPTGYYCEASQSAGDCAQKTEPGETSNVAGQAEGSRIKRTVGTFTNNGDGTAKVTARGGGSATVGINGAQMSQTPIGAGSRQDRAAAAQDKGASAGGANGAARMGVNPSSEDLSEHVGGRGIRKDGFVLDSKGNIVSSDEVLGPFVEADRVEVTDGMAKVRYVKNGVNYYHAGKDLVPLNADGSVRIDAYAISGTEGTVLAIRRASGFGDHAVVVRTPKGNQAVYGHMESIAPGLIVGQKVSVGTRLGIIGNEGLPTHMHPTKGLHLHIEIRQGDVAFKGKRYGL